jgi:ATP-dependent helicase/nuclease subunit A
MTDLLDKAHRERIDTDLDRHLFVKAGAGSGKTHHLVRRILALIGSGVPIRSIAAITFTEKAAGELRQRVRTALTEDNALTPQQCSLALDELDAAPIGTIHSFATRILEDNPIEAGLPPAIEVIDELRSQIAFVARWRRVRAALFSDAESSQALEVLLAAGMTLVTLEEVVRDLDASWDRLATTESTAPVPSSIDLGPLLNQAMQLAERRSDCLDESDGLLEKFVLLDEWISHARDAIASDNLGRSFELLGSAPTKGRYGKAANWRNNDVASVKQGFDDLVADAKSLANSAIQPAIERIVTVVAAVLIDEARQRQRSGTLEFHDLLVLSRDLLVGPQAEAVHGRLHEQFQRILLDEFQDTDPLQAELAFRIAAPELAEIGNWRALAIPAGRLFMVGDPKQSIYRFRRADIATFLSLLDLSLASDAEAAVSMSTNFRSTKPVLDWINTVFGTLITADGSRQPDYEPLTHNPARPDWNEDAGGPAVSVLGGSPDDPMELGDATERRRREAADIAATIVLATGNTSTPGWLKQDPRTFELSPITPQDICILIPTRASLPALEAALEARNIDFIAEASSLIYSTQEIHDLLLALESIANTADEAALVLSLRSPLFGCGDDDLLKWHEEAGHWNIFAPAPRGLDASPVGEAMTFLRELSRAAVTSGPADLLDRLVTERYVREISLDSPRYRDVWRRIRFVIDQARAWSEATFGSLRDYLVWTDSQSEDGARVKESIVPDSGLEAVRITTIHGAKGRQFPMVILSGMSSGWKAGSARVLWNENQAPLVAFKSASAGTLGAATDGHTAAALSEKDFLIAERVRQLYVACTRAESHLVVSAYPPTRKPSWSALMSEAVSVATHVNLSGVLDHTQSMPPKPTQNEIGLLPEYLEWQSLREAWSARSTTKASSSVTAQAKGGRSEDGVPQLTFVDDQSEATIEPLQYERSAEHGTEFGTAVHRVLELSGLSPSADIDQIAADVGLVAGIASPTQLAALARNALQSAPVSAAATREHWLELPVGAFDGTLVLEGVADLVYRDDDSLVIVDFKTDIAMRDESVEAYWRQLTAYAELIERASGDKVSGLALVFCRESPARVLTRNRG